MVEFKAGDRVRCLKNSDTQGGQSQFTKGNIYIVNRVSGVGHGVLHMLDDRGITNGWNSDNFELVQSFKPGDKVRYIKHFEVKAGSYPKIDEIVTITDYVGPTIRLKEYCWAYKDASFELVEDVSPVVLTLEQISESIFEWQQQSYRDGYENGKNFAQGKMKALEEKLDSLKKILGA